MAFHGECKHFIASDTVQKVLSILWTSAIVFSPNRILYYKNFNFLQVIKNKDNKFYIFLNCIQYQEIDLLHDIWTNCTFFSIL
jgi:hypothetical protein